jgi:hypothetical protein
MVMRRYALPWLVVGVLGAACGTTSPAKGPRSDRSVIDLTSRPTVQVEAASRRIACGFGEVAGTATVRCDVQGRWNVTTPANCHGGYGDSVELRAYTAPQLGCHTDTVFAPKARIIPNGTTVRYAQITCVFAASGVTCGNGAHERFLVSPRSYTFG